MRRFNVQPASRPTYYDRNPISKVFGFQLNTGPHAATTRWSYTCPVGKKAYAEMLWNGFFRSLGATASSTFQTLISFTPNGGGSVNLDILQDNTNVVTVVYTSHFFSSVGAMTAGDVVQNVTTDVSTGGSVTYSNALKVFEFDA